jgi:exosortase B
MASASPFGRTAGNAAPANAPAGAGARAAGRRTALEWLPIAAALAVLYVPTFRDVAQTFWSQERGTSGPIILAVVAWLFWRERAALLDTADRPRTATGAVVLALGLALYAVGRSQAFYQPEVFSLIPVLVGCLLLMRGARTLRRLWFPLVFLLFAVPLPGSLMDAILVPLKQQVSATVEWVLHGLGYPVARTGVVLTIGQYQLLIADACSGLASMMALTGIGVLYVYVAGHKSIAHNVILLASELPFAFVSNVIRVIILMLGTYHLGEAVGQRLHDVMQYIQMAMTFGLFFLFDWVLSRLLPGRARTEQAA